MKQICDRAKKPDAVMDLLSTIYKLAEKKNFTGLFLKILVISMFLFTLQSCDLKLDEEVDHIPERPFDVAPGITDMHNFMSLDTLYFYAGQESTFDFKSDTSNKQILSIKIFIDNEPMKYTNSRLKFPVKPGIYKLKAEIYTGTETGSIANLADYERHLIEKEWTLIIYKIENFSEIQGKYSFVNGRLKLEWDEFPYPFIKEYQIIDPWTCPATHILFTRNNSIYDSTYWGFIKPFQINVITKGNSVLYWCQIIVPEIAPNISISYADSSCEKLKIMWDAPPYYDHLTSASLYISNNLHSISNNVRDTVSLLDFDQPFGKENMIYLRYKWKSFAEPKIAASKRFNYGNTYTPFNKDGQIIPVNNNVAIHLYPTWRMITYNTELVSTGDTLHLNEHFMVNLNLTTSPNGTQYAYVTNKGKIRTGLVNNLSQNIISPTILPGTTGNEELRISDNKIACIKSSIYTLKFYDLNTMQAIQLFDAGAEIDKITNMSSDAKYFSITFNNSDHVYKREDEAITKLYELQSQSGKSFLSFNPLNSEQFFYYDSQEFSCRNLNNSVINFSYPLEADKILHLDIANNRMLVAVGNNLCIISITDGKMLNQIPFSQDNPVGKSIGQNSILIGNKIVSNSLFYCF